MKKTYIIRMTNGDKYEFVMKPETYDAMLDTIVNSNTYVFIGNTDDIILNVRNISSIICQ